jgi:hypothetical protein
MGKGGMRWARHVARMGKVRNANIIWIGKPERQSALGRPGRRCEDNIRSVLKEITLKFVHWMHLAQCMDQWLTLLKTEMKLRSP